MERRHEEDQGDGSDRKEADAFDVPSAKRGKRARREVILIQVLSCSVVPHAPPVLVVCVDTNVEDSFRSSSQCSLNLKGHSSLKGVYG